MTTLQNTITLTNAGTAYSIAASNGDMTIQNNNATANIYLGTSAVTTSDYGFKLVPGMAIAFELNGTDSIWAVSDTAGAKVNTLRVALEGTYIV